jgi:hypothetical protein
MTTRDESRSAGHGDELERLRRELGDATDEPVAPDRTAADLVSEATDALSDGGAFAFGDETVKGDLAEILLTLVATRSSETNGKRLMEDLGDAFGTELSPGTLYPELHDLEDEGLLERHELVRTKEYEVSDRDSYEDRVSARMRQHLVLALYYRQALEGGGRGGDTPTPGR